MTLLSRVCLKFVAKASITGLERESVKSVTIFRTLVDSVPA